MPELVTLLDYANDRDQVVVFWHTAVDRDIRYYPAGSPDWEADGILDKLYPLQGTVAETGDWVWDGEGDPTDARGNSIEAVSADIDAKAWKRLTADAD